jgi:hypothetical protein
MSVINRRKLEYTLKLYVARTNVKKYVNSNTITKNFTSKYLEKQFSGTSPKYFEELDIEKINYINIFMSDENSTILQKVYEYLLDQPNIENLEFLANSPNKFNPINTSKSYLKCEDPVLLMITLLVRIDAIFWRSFFNMKDQYFQQIVGFFQEIKEIFESTFGSDSFTKSGPTIFSIGEIFYDNFTNYVNKNSKEVVIEKLQSIFPYIENINLFEVLQTY